jgi:hypothetical protein
MRMGIFLTKNTYLNDFNVNATKFILWEIYFSNTVIFILLPFIKAEEYGDIIQSDIVEHPFNVTLQTLSSLEWYKTHLSKERVRKLIYKHAYNVILID